MNIATLPSAQHQEKYENLVKGKIKQSVSPARHLLMQFQQNLKMGCRVDKNQMQKIDVHLDDE